MPRPRVSNSYVHRSTNVIDKPEGEGSLGCGMEVPTIKVEEPDCDVITIEEDHDEDSTGKKSKSLAGELPKLEVRRFNTIKVVDTDKLTARVPVSPKETATVLAESPPESFVDSSGRITQSETQSSAKTVKFLRNSSGKLYQLPPDSSSSIQRGPESYNRIPPLVPIITRQVPRTLSDQSTRVTQPPPNSSFKVAQSTPDSIRKIGQLVAKSAIKVADSTSGAADRSSDFSKRSTGLFASSSARSTRPGPIGGRNLPLDAGNSQKPKVQLLQTTGTAATRLKADAHGSVTQPVANPSSQLLRPLRNSSVKVTQLIPDADGKLTPHIKDARNNPNIVMVLPPSNATNKFIKNPGNTTLEKIHNAKGTERASLPDRNNANQMNSQKKNAPLSRNVARPTNVPKASIEMHHKILHKYPPERRTQSPTFRREETENKKNLISRESTLDSPVSTNEIAFPAKKVPISGFCGPKIIPVKEIMKKSCEPVNSIDLTGKDRDDDSDGDSTAETSRKVESTTAMAKKDNGLLAVRSSERHRKLAALEKTEGGPTEVPADSDLPAAKKWQAGCIVCQQRFDDKYELHRHATLSHPGVRIVFCELCSASFRTNDELELHRASYHKIIALEQTGIISQRIEKRSARKTTRTWRSQRESEDEGPRTRTKNMDEERVVRCKKSTSCKGINSKQPAGERSCPSDSFAGRLTKKKIADSSVSAKISQAGAPVIVGTRGKNLRTKNKSEKSTYDYVDIEVVRYEGAATKNKFKCAEIRKLIVPLTRLEAPVLDKYLRKLATRPESNFGSGGSRRLRSSSSNSNDRFAAPRTRSRNEGSARLTAPEDSEKVHKILRHRRKYRKKDADVISKESRSVKSSPKVSDGSATPRRSTRRRMPKKSVYGASDETTDDESSKVHSSDDDYEQSSRTKKQRKFKKRISNTESTSSDELTPIEIVEAENIAEIVKEQRVIRKLVSRSSVSSCTTLENNRERINSYTEKRSTEDDADVIPSFSPVRRHSMYTSSDDQRSRERVCKKKLRQSRSKKLQSRATSSSDESPLRERVRPKKSWNLVAKEPKSWSSDERSSRKPEEIKGSRILPTGSLKTFRTEDKSVDDEIKTKKSRYMLRKHSSDKDPTKTAVGPGSCDTNFNEMTNVNEDMEKELEKSNDAQENSAREKIDDGDAQQTENCGRETEPQKENTNNDDKLLEEKTGDKDSREILKVKDKGSEDRSDHNEKRFKLKIRDDKKSDEIMDVDVEAENEAQPKDKADGEEKQTGKKISDIEENDDEKNRSEESRKKGSKQPSDDSPEQTSSGKCDRRIERTYAPRKKPPTVVKILINKRGETEKKATSSRELCFTCAEFEKLEKKIWYSTEVIKNPEAPIRCPLCYGHHFFVSMFYLELHITTRHLPCLAKVPCQKSRLPEVEKILQVAKLNCQTQIQTEIECLRCPMKFKVERDLNDHVLAVHGIGPAKDVSSAKAPRYLGDLATSCLQTITRGNPNSRRDQTKWEQGASCKKKLEDPALELEMNRTPGIRCSLCGLKFSTSIEYVSHIRKIHDSIRQPIKTEEVNSKTLGGNVEHEQLFYEDSWADVTNPLDADEIFSIPSAEPVADFEDLTQQRLSDDPKAHEEKKPSDISPEPTKQTFDETSKANIVEDSTSSKVVGFVTTLHTCKVCQKKFKRAQDVIIHSLGHVNNEIPKRSDTENARLEKSSLDEEPFADPSSRDNIDDSSRINREKLSEKNDPASIESNENTNDVAPVYAPEDPPGKVATGSKRRATSPPNESLRGSATDKKINTAKKQKINSSKTPGTKNVVSKDQSSGDTKKDTANELTEMEVGLADESNEKMPLSCNKCNRHFANRSLLNEHLFFLHDDALKDTVLTNVLTPMERLIGPDDSESSQRWFCSICVQNFKMFQGYSRHCYLLHGDDTLVHVCENCSKILTNVTMVNVHICTDVDSYDCKSCKKTFSSGMSLRLHNTEKHLETNGPHVCEPCKKTFLTGTMLERHDRLTHDASPASEERKRSPVRTVAPDSTNNEEFKETASTNTVEDKKEKVTIAVITKKDKVEESVPLRRGRGRPPRKKKIVGKTAPANLKRLPSGQTAGKRKRGRPRKYPLSEEESSWHSSQTEGEENEEAKADDILRNSTLYVDETEIYQCSVCQIYCLTRTALRNHMAKIHSILDEVCQLCQKMFPAGKLIRHMIDRHVDWDDPSDTRIETSLQIGTDSREIDTRIFTRMLGITRLISLCEYRRYSETVDRKSYPCPYCDRRFPSNELYRYHFLLIHDTMCALCNIEFKRAPDAARHKNEVHGSAGRYIWFADRTMMLLASTKNFADVAENIFIKMLSKDETVNEDEETEDFLGENDTEIGTLGCTEILVYSDGVEKEVRTIVFDDKTMRKGISSMDEIIEMDEQDEETRAIADTSFPEEFAGGTEEAKETALVENSIAPEVTRGNSGKNVLAEEPCVSNNVSSSIMTEAESKRSDDATSSINDAVRIASGGKTELENAADASAKPEDPGIIIVVTDDDLERFNIATRHPNIWGLAAQISATFDDITPKDVKELLARHFERQEDFDT